MLARASPIFLKRHCGSTLEHFLTRVPAAMERDKFCSHKPEAPAKLIMPPSAAPSRPVNLGLGDLVLIVTCLYTAVW